MVTMTADIAPSCPDRKMRELRKECGLSQVALVCRRGLDRSYVGSVERGKSNIGLVNITKIADAQPLDVRQLFRLPVRRQQE